MKGRSPSSSSDAGFMLADMLVALFILSLIMLLLAEAVYGIRNIRRALEAHLQMQRFMQVQKYLFRSLHSIAPYLLPGDRLQASAYLRGTQKSVSYVHAYAVDSQWAGLYVNRLFLEKSGDTRSLVLEQRLYDGRHEGGGRLLSRKVLLRDVEDLSFSYAAAGANDRLVWKTEWRDPQYLPRLIAIRISLRYLPEKRWPRIIVPIPVQP